MNMLARRLILLGLLAALIGLTAGCSGSQTNSAAISSPDSEIALVQKGTLISSVSATGSVRAHAEVALAFDIVGRVSEVLVEAGDRVQQGTPLIRLDTADLELRVRGAEAALVAAQAQLDQLKAGPRLEEVRGAQGRVDAGQAALDQALAQQEEVSSGATEAEIAAARAMLASAQSTYNKVRAGPTAAELGTTRAAVESAQAAVGQAQAAYDQVRDRPDVALLPQSLALQNATIELNRAQAAYDQVASRPTPSDLAAAAAQVAQAEAQLARLEGSSKPQSRVSQAGVTAAKAERDIAQAQLDLLLAGATPAQLAAAKANVDQAQVALDSARLALARATLYAPLDGVVTLVNVEPGEMVPLQTSILALVDDSRFTIEADVDEVDIGGVGSGQEVRLTFDAFPGQELSGRVVSIASVATLDTGVVTYRLRIEPSASDLPLRAGMTANTEIVKDRRSDVLLVPNMAIFLDDTTGRKFVARKTATGVEETEITTGLTTDILSEVVTGLTEGDQILVASMSARDQFRNMMGASLTGRSE